MGMAKRADRGPSEPRHPAAGSPNPEMNADVTAAWNEIVAALSLNVADDADRRLTLTLIPSLWPLYGGSDREVLSHLSGFCRSHCEQIQFVAAHHAEDPRVAPLLHQPELPLILDRLEADPTGLLDAWPPAVPRIWLEALAEAWGSPL
jgi:hypothetical protein